MNAAAFRKLALALPETVEQSHHAHPDFRVGGKIFASLAPDDSWAMVKLDAAQQSLHCTAEPGVYAPAQGAWGRAGSTIVQLSKARTASVKRALEFAWRNTAPRKLLREHAAE
jgi:hypothetical protein